MRRQRCVRYRAEVDNTRAPVGFSLLHGRRPRRVVHRFTRLGLSAFKLGQKEA